MTHQTIGIASESIGNDSPGSGDELFKKSDRKKIYFFLSKNILKKKFEKLWFFLKISVEKIEFLK